MQMHFPRLLRLGAILCVAIASTFPAGAFESGFFFASSTVDEEVNGLKRFLFPVLVEMPEGAIICLEFDKNFGKKNKGSISIVAEAYDDLAGLLNRETPIASAEMAARVHQDSASGCATLSGPINAFGLIAISAQRKGLKPKRMPPDCAYLGLISVQRIEANE
jgi:hypothetical protein